MINQTRLNIIYIKNLCFESENQLKMMDFVEKFKNTSNHIKTFSGRQLKKTIFVQFT